MTLTTAHWQIKQTVTNMQNILENPMGYCKQLWIDENEEIMEQFLNDEITTAEFTDWMKARGFDLMEISDMVTAIEEDK